MLSKKYKVSILTNSESIFSTTIKKTKDMELIYNKEGMSEVFNFIAQQVLLPYIVAYGKDKFNNTSEIIISSNTESETKPITKEYLDALEKSITSIDKPTKFHNGVKQGIDFKRVSYDELMTREQMNTFMMKLSYSSKLIILANFKKSSRKIILDTYKKCLDITSLTADQLQEWNNFLNECDKLPEHKGENPNLKILDINIERFQYIDLYEMGKDIFVKSIIDSCDKHSAELLLKGVELAYGESNLPDDFYEREKEIMDYYKLKII